ncbi:MAG: hypothetical protein JRD05_10440 [Deltaproteobacteria bacterium]|nr:hypothetical protein [Deltaproteobacteria bacterium]
MKCTNHPKIDAVGQCSECGSFLCNVCVASEEAGSIKCDRCSMFSTLTALTQIKIEAKERRDKRIVDDAVKKQKRRKSRLLITVAIAALIAVIELVWHFSISHTEIKEFVPSEKTFVTTTVINEAIINYREDHGEKVPDSLEDLAGDYLPKDQRWKNSLRDFTYRKITPYKYELIPPETASDTLPDLIFTEEGVKLIGM